MEQLVTIAELAARLPFEMDADEEREAEGVLDDLSDDARYYGKESWELAATAPRQVKNLILRAAVRHMKNSDGFTQSRAGDEAVGFTDRGHESGSAYFTDREQRILRELAGRSSGFHSVGLVAHGSANRELAGYVPVEGGDKPMPYFNDEEDGW